MSAANAQLRRYGEEENRFVRTNTFGPNASMYHQPQRVRETAEAACESAESAFGAGDPIHIRALVNLALFHWHRRKSASDAEPALRQALDGLKREPALDREAPDVAAELIATRILLRRLAGRDETDLGLVERVCETIPSVFGVRDADTITASAKIFARMVELALSAPEPVTAYLIAEAGPPLALELLARGRSATALDLLRGSLLPLSAKVWGDSEPHTLALARLADWISAGAVSAESRPYRLDRLEKHLRGLWKDGVQNPAARGGLWPWRSRKPDRKGDSGADTPLAESFRTAQQAIGAFLAADARDRDRLARDATTALDEPIRRIDDLRANSDRPIQHAGECLLSQACLIASSAPPDPRQAQERAIELVNQYLTLAYDGRTADAPLMRDRARVILAELYSERLSGEPEDNLDEMSVHTDSLDLEPDRDAYHWALGKYLRGQAYTRRRGWKASGEAAPDLFRVQMDVMAAIESYKSALDVFTVASHPWEWARTLLGWSETVVPMMLETVTEDAARGMSRQLDLAEFVLTPLTDPPGWVAIQALRARIAERPLAPDDEDSAENGSDDARSDVPDGDGPPTYFGDSPAHILARAQAILDRDRQPILWSRLELEKARHFARQGHRFDDAAIGAFRAVIGALGEAAPEMRFAAHGELAERLFDQSRFEDAAEAYQAALTLGVARIDASFTMGGRRLAIYDLKDISENLAYCYARMGRNEAAAIIADTGKSILLNESLRTRYAEALLPALEDPQSLVRLTTEIRTLEADGYGGMGTLEGSERLIALGDALKQFDLPDRDTFSRAGLTHVSRDTAVLIPVITRHGAVAFVSAPDGAGGHGVTAVELPTLTTSVVREWLFGTGEAGWLGAFKRRNDYGPGEEAFWAMLLRITEWLGEALFSPVLERLMSHRISDLVIVPSGGLQLLPLHAALLAAADGWDYLDERFAVRVMPSAATLALIDGARRAPADAPAVVVGVASYADEALPDLDTVAAEARAVAACLGAEPLLDDQAERTTLARAVKGARFVHLACHGAQWAENPQFGRSWRPEPVLHLQKGGLSFRDILVDWDLCASDLVTLSACDTGVVSFARPWDEFEGLPHVLLQAGARAVIGSLWSVDDESTTLLMTRLYENLGQGAPVAQALRDARRWLRNATDGELRENHGALYAGADGPATDDRPFAHPYYWAPFFLVG